MDINIILYLYIDINLFIYVFYLLLFLCICKKSLVLSTKDEKTTKSNNAVAKGGILRGK